MVHLKEIIESDVNGLQLLRAETFSSYQFEVYYKVFYHYLVGDHEELYKIIEILKQKVKFNPELIIVLLIAQLRYSIRTNQNLKENMDALLQLETLDPQWKGEAYCVISSAASYLELHEKARDYSFLAAKELKAMGAKKKAVRMLMNAIASESCFRPEKHYLSDLMYIYKEAKASGDTIRWQNHPFSIN